MQVRPCRTSARPFIANHISTLHVHPDLRIKRGQMAVPGSHAKAVINHNQAAISRAPVYYADDSISSGADVIAIVRRNVHARVKRTFTTERVKPLAEVTGNFTLHRPERRDNPQAA